MTDDTTTHAHDWVLILAAGNSTRFKGVKALAPWRTGTLLSQAVRTARRVCGARVMVVTGGHAEQLQATLADTLFTHNPHWSRGMGTSLAAGTHAIRTHDPHVTHVTILPVDQPLVTPGHLRRLAILARRDGRPVFTGARETVGPPVCVPAAHLQRLLTLDGATGLKQVCPAAMRSVLVNEAALCDIDTPADLTRLASRHTPQAGPEPKNHHRRQSENRNRP